MEHIEVCAKDVVSFLTTLPQVKHCELYGSLKRGKADLYSDIDIEVDVSGSDNSAFVIALPTLMEARYPIIFQDYAASLAPDLYISTFAIYEDNPFRLIDINCVATPHCPKRSKQEISAMCRIYDHALKMFSVYLKQRLRGQETPGCFSRLYTGIFEKDCVDDIFAMKKIYQWLGQNTEEKQRRYVESFVYFSNELE